MKVVRALQIAPRPGLWKMYPLDCELLDSLVEFVCGVELAECEGYSTVLNDEVEKFLREFAKSELRFAEEVERLIDFAPPHGWRAEFERA